MKSIDTSCLSRLESNKVLPEDRPVHEWYRFVLSFPPHLVRTYLERFDISEDKCVLDPFCGTGTTLVECKKGGIPSIGIEANPMANLASRVKVSWDVDAEKMRQQACNIADATLNILRKQDIEDDLPFFHNGAYLQCIVQKELRTLPADAFRLLLSKSICPLPLHKTLILRDCIGQRADREFAPFFQLAMAKALIHTIGNLHFGPEVGVGKPKGDASVVNPWLTQVERMAADLKLVQHRASVRSEVHQTDARGEWPFATRPTIDGVITSPPYPNEKDYTRTTRLESVILGLIRNKAELRTLKQTLVRSNTRGVYKQDDDDEYVASHPEIQRIAAAIEKRRIELGKTSGFERLYPRVTRLYFGGMVRHLRQLQRFLRPGAQLAYVVGDQASYLRVMIRTGQILADLAGSLGYEVEGIDLFRTRLATATKEQLREEVVILRWPEKRKIN